MGTVIVGASVAGVSAADGLRSQGYDGRIILVDGEEGLPYDKPPLSKAALRAGWQPDRALLRSAQHYTSQGIELRLGQRAVRLDAGGARRRRVYLANGTSLDADHVVIATGLRPRRLPDSSMVPGVWCLRSTEDSRGIREALEAKPRVVVVGGGFIGAEAAGVAAEQGAAVTIVEAMTLPFVHIFGHEVASPLAARHAAHQVELICGEGVHRVVREDGELDVVLSSGRSLKADIVLLGLGAIPVTGWLECSGVEVADGVVCDQYGRTSVHDVYAAGDVAGWWDVMAGEHHRAEHWTTAKEQGAVVAHNIVHGDDDLRTVSPVPYFWSDQYGARLQFLGTSAGHDSVHLATGSLEGDSFVVLYGRRQKLIGALGLRAARDLMPYRSHIARGADLESLPGLRSISAPAGVA